MKMFKRRLIIACACVLWLCIVAHAAQSTEEAEQPVAAQDGASGGDVRDTGSAVVVNSAGSASYLIGPGDMIDISVWKDEALTKSVVVLPDGYISFPLIGEIKAVGRPISQIKAEIEEKIKPYVPDPTVSVEVKQVNSMLVYVIGRVNSLISGRYVLNANVNVLQALAMAGGLNPFAKRNKIRVLRQEGDKTLSFPFNYDDVVDGKRLEQNIMLKRGDVVVVP